MSKKQFSAMLCAAVCLTACLTACSSERSTADSAGSEQTSEVSSEETSEAAAEETETSAPEEEKAEETEAPAETTDAPEAESTDAPEAEATEPAAEEPAEPVNTTNPNRTDGDTKILWSERGLEAVPVNSVSGYGTELKVGDKYLGWKFDSFDGILNDSATGCSEVYADFTYDEGTLAVNGILTVLPKDHPDYPNGMYLRVDNQADFPYFPQDSRERGRFIIENARDVFPMLGLDDPPVNEQYDVAVSVSVTTLHIHVAPNGYDTIRVTAASKR